MSVSSCDEKPQDVIVRLHKNKQDTNSAETAGESQTWQASASDSGYNGGASVTGDEYESLFTSSPERVKPTVLTEEHLREHNKLMMESDYTALPVPVGIPKAKAGSEITTTISDQTANEPRPPSTGKTAAMQGTSKRLLQANASNEVTGRCIRAKVCHQADGSAELQPSADASSAVGHSPALENRKSAQPDLSEVQGRPKESARLPGLRRCGGPCLLGVWSAAPCTKTCDLPYLHLGGCRCSCHTDTPDCRCKFCCTLSGAPGTEPNNKQESEELKVQDLQDQIREGVGTVQPGHSSTQTHLDQSNAGQGLAQDLELPAGGEVDNGSTETSKVTDSTSEAFIAAWLRPLPPTDVDWMIDNHLPITAPLAKWSSADMEDTEIPDGLGPLDFDSTWAWKEYKYFHRG